VLTVEDVSSLIVLVGVWIVQGLMLLLAGQFIPGLHVASWPVAFGAAIVIGVLNSALWPAFIRVIQRFNLLLFVLLTFVLNGICVLVAGALLPGLTVDGLWTAFLVSLSLTLATTVFTTLFAFHDADYYTRWIIKRSVSRQAGATATNVPGFLFLQIDGLSEAVLRQAVANGHVPTIVRWLAEGTHKLTGWEANLPCQTSASQAGILHGSNLDIPAFRWLEKESGRIFVSNHPSDARDIEARVSDGHGLLADGGVGRGNIFSGDAAEVMLTFSTVLDASKHRSANYVAYMSSPVNLARTILLVLWEICLELWARLSAHLRHVEPHGQRGFPYPLVRAFTTTFLRDVVVYTLIGDMFRGVPAAYADFVGYDEVAHHSGIAQPDTLAVLRRIDQQLGRLERAARSAPRPYHFVLLSDHGQTQGATFRQRYGISLGEHIHALMDSDKSLDDISHDADSWGSMNAFLTESSTPEGEPSSTGQLTRTVVKNHTRDGLVEYGPSTPRTSEANVTVLASGNLGLVYFNDLAGRLTYEQIAAAYPRVIPGLIQHPGVGFVMVRTERGPIAISGRGIHFLAENRVEGSDPLANFGRRAGQHLLRLDGFTHTPDILVNSFYDPATDEAAAFEELIGGHGGLGGKQMQPFLLYPSVLTLEDPEIVGAEQLHCVLQRWRRQTQQTPSVEPPTP
jgi:putative membrane protein